MAAPVASITVDPTSGAQTEADPTVAVTLTDASTGDPEITDRTWTVGGVELDATDEAVVLDFIAVGVYNVVVGVTNGDGSDNDTGTVTVTDSYTPPAYAAGETADRILPHLLPASYQDALACTPGVPDGQRIALAEHFGTILPTGDRGAVLFGGEVVAAVANP